jgi:hypothetical protein
MADILVPELRRVAVMLHMILILRHALDIHVSRIPIALLRNTLRAPMSPDAELGIPKPLRATIGFQ